MTDWVAYAAVGVIVAATVPLIVAAYQILLVLGHKRIYLRHLSGYLNGSYTFPNVTILVPAWNEADVLAASVTRLCELKYPSHQLRVCVVDDASTDATGEVMADLRAVHGDRVIHLRREHGGQGKAHTLNAGLDLILNDQWSQAVLITDADVLFTDNAVTKMARHFADPSIGAVTAYIKEGSQPGTWMTKSVRYEYASAQAAARRGYNVIGTHACLAGGAQLHTCDNLRQLGGHIDTTTLAEDTVTTFNTQLAGRRVIFEPNALVYAEEPNSIRALWGQRLRWARGNLQVTAKYFPTLMNPFKSRLGNPAFTITWFSVLAQPFLMIAASLALLYLALVPGGQAPSLLRYLWLTAFVVYLLVLVVVFAVDTTTFKQTWKQGVAYPGVVNLALMLAAIRPSVFAGLQDVTGDPDAPATAVALFAYTWLAVAMVVAWLAKQVEGPGRFRHALSRFLLVIAGYGPLLCAVGIAAAAKQLRRADNTWTKTEKTGRVQLGAQQ